MIRIEVGCASRYLSQHNTGIEFSRMRTVSKLKKMEKRERKRKNDRVLQVRMNTKEGVLCYGSILYIIS